MGKAQLQQTCPSACCIKIFLENVTPLRLKGQFFTNAHTLYKNFRSLIFMRWSGKICWLLPLISRGKFLANKNWPWKWKSRTLASPENGYSLKGEAWAYSSTLQLHRCVHCNLLCCTTQNLIILHHQTTVCTAEGGIQEQLSVTVKWIWKQRC